MGQPLTYGRPGDRQKTRNGARRPSTSLRMRFAISFTLRRYSPSTRSLSFASWNSARSWRALSSSTMSWLPVWLKLRSKSAQRTSVPASPVRKSCARSPMRTWASVVFANVKWSRLSQVVFKNLIGSRSCHRCLWEWKKHCLRHISSSSVGMESPPNNVPRSWYVALVTESPKSHNVLFLRHERASCAER